MGESFFHTKCGKSTTLADDLAGDRPSDFKLRPQHPSDFGAARREQPLNTAKKSDVE
jgi:hypothetical protein